MNVIARWLGLDGSRWARVGPHSWWSATAVVIVASSLLALTRFGGLVTSAPRAFTRLALVGVWGWIGLAVTVWAIVVAVGDARPPLRVMFGIVGLAHVPMLALSFVIFVFGVLAQQLGPGLVAALLVLGLWFPATITAGVHHLLGAGPARAVTVVALPYSAWLLIVGRHIIGQVGHLL